MQNPRLSALHQAGVSIWLDDLDRHRIESGNLAGLIDTMSVVGVTTNPSIFEKAMTSGVAEYQPQLAALAAAGASAETAVRELTVHDVQAACDVLHSVWQNSNGTDGRVSLEVDPRLANDTTGTIAQAKELWAAVNRPNLMIKIPATLAGLPAITEVLAAGISVNVTLIFSESRYRLVLDAWLAGLEKAQAAGLDLSQIESVASFFVSRVDTLVDKKLDALGTPEAAAVRGKAAIANAALAWQAFLDVTGEPRWQALAASGAKVQRPLWASTGVKDPTYDDTRYVIELVAPNTVNTMPEATLNAVADHGVVRGDTVTGTADDARAVWAELAALGISSDEVFAELETDGVAKFIAAWEQLLASIEKVLQEAK
ncbi:MAG: transaldolase [Actinomycetales bacterium]|nr:transaldolase [Actinomycetales bacterium]